MTPRDRLHRRQFVIGPEPLLLDESWRSIQLGPTRHLSHCLALPVARAQSPDGRTFHLLGTAVQTDRTKPRPVDQLSQMQGEAPSELYRDWCGRWVLLADASLHPDASALLGCYYCVDGPEAVETWVSSSPAILCALRADSTPDLGGRLLHAQGMDWYPPPRSRYRDIHRLLPSQTLELSDDRPASVAPRRLTTDDFGEAGYDELLDFIDARLVGGMEAIAGEANELWLPLTAGFDSRLLLALAKRVDAPVAAYTFDKPSSLISPADRTMPPRLAASVGTEHRLIERGEFSESRARVFDAHTAEHTADIDREYLARGQWDQIPREALILRGGVFEVGRTYYHGRLAYDGLEDLDRTYAHIAAAFGFESLHAESRSHAEGLREWIAWCLEEPDPGIDWRDRFYLEQRVAGWLAPIEQALDLTGPERIHLANASATISALVALPLEVRRRTKHHRDLIGRSAPELLRFKFNPPGSTRQAVVGKARGALRRLKSIGRRVARTRPST